MSVVPRLPLSLLLACLLAGCASRAPQAATAVTFIVVRHAEKVLDDSRDPPLTAAGQARAEALAASLADAPLRAVYATAFARTRQTAAPAARSHALQVITYEAKQTAAQLAAHLRRAHRTGAVLVVGHSNTVPGIAAALCGCDVAAMAETEYDRRMTILIAADGATRLMVARDP